jgi:processive 1,2-diacylglycerol beta-glucosyltransferase
VPAHPPRVLIFSADIGEGHDLPARLLLDAIAERSPAAEVAIADSLRAAGRVVYKLVRDGVEGTLERFPWAYDAQYFLITRLPTRLFTSWLAWRMARRGLARVIADFRPDVIVSTYPGANEVLGRMRRAGELDAPLVSAITDLAALRFWAHPEFDLHLIIHAESEPEVRKLAGPRTRIAHVSGLTDPVFLEPVTEADARRGLGLPADGPVVVISGGGWGVGDLEGAVRVCLDARPGLTAVALCGRNDALRERIERDFAGEPRVRAVGFTDRMGDYLAAADVLVHSTAGLTVLEAQIRGARVISYGWGVGHIRANNRAYREFGLAEVASTPAALARALESALASPREPDLSLAALPSAADLTLELVAEVSPSPSS